jgi:hypothetical protein
MTDKGELDRFAWVWKSSAPGWQPLDPMPAPLDESKLPEDAPPMPSVSPPLPPPARKHLRLVGDLIEGVCHDYRNVVAGRVVQVTDVGCDLLVDGTDAATPKFSDRAKVYLNLLNSKNGQTMDVVAQLSSVSHSREGWLYRLEWESVPELLRANG